MCIAIYGSADINGMCADVYTFNFVGKYLKKHNLGQVNIDHLRQNKHTLLLYLASRTVPVVNREFHQ